MPRPLWKGAISFGLVHIPVVLTATGVFNVVGGTKLRKKENKSLTAFLRAL